MANRAVARARGLIGARFRLHGRDPETGIDCVGVVAAAHRIERAPRGYAVRTADDEGVAVLLRSFGFREARAPRPGDVALIRPGPAQCHLAVLTEVGFVHADAGLGRVVETPGAPANLLSCWRKGR